MSVERIIVIAVALSLLSSAPAAAQDRNSSTPYQERIGDFLAKHNAVVSWDTAMGYGENVYLVPRNEEGDLFINVLVEAELRNRLTDLSDLYVFSSLETKQYLSETDANEMFVDLFGEYHRVRQVWGLGTSGLVSYQDYSSFDEEGGVVPAGKYQAWENELGTSADWQMTRSQELESGVSYRIKDYGSSDLDFDEMGLNVVHRCDLNEKTRTKLSFEHRSQDYDDLQTLAADGTLEEANPTVQLEIRKIRLALHRKLRKFAWVDIYVHQTESEENFEGEGSYDEIGLGGSWVSQISRIFAMEGSATVYRRDYDKRLVPDLNSTQTDDFLSLKIMLERRLWGTVSAYGAVELNSRDSNDSSEEYDEHSLSFGIRGVL